MRRLHEAETGAELRVEFLAEDEPQAFIREHQRVLSGALEEVEMSDAMRGRLNSSHYVFSGMKTFHELKEAFPELTRADGSRKGFREFLSDVRKVDETYNGAWLRAEYNFAHRSAQMAARWEASEKHGDRYLLQYRTQSDDKVRAEHAALHGVTLEKTDGFWDYYLPPNGWGCRCTVVEVLREQYVKTPHDEAMELGEEATKNDRRNMFRWNSGKKGRTFPDYNPYTISRCRDCDMTRKLADSGVMDNEVCAACRVVRSVRRSSGAANRISRYDENEWEHSYISKNDDGYVVTSKERIMESQASNNEKKKFKKEMRMCKVLADNGHDVEYLRGVNRPVGQTYDIFMDGIKADLKCITGGAGNIVKYAKKTLTKQGGEAVVFEFPNSPGVEFYEALAEARRKCNGRIFFYIFGDNILKEVK